MPVNVKVSLVGDEDGNEDASLEGKVRLQALVMDFGLCFPLLRFIREFFNYFNISLAQFPVNGWKILLTLEVFIEVLGAKIGLQEAR